MFSNFQQLLFLIHSSLGGICKIVNTIMKLTKILLRTMKLTSCSTRTLFWIPIIHNFINKWQYPYLMIQGLTSYHCCTYLNQNPIPFLNMLTQTKSKQWNGLSVIQKQLIWWSCTITGSIQVLFALILSVKNMSCFQPVLTLNLCSYLATIDHNNAHAPLGHLYDIPHLLKWLAVNKYNKHIIWFKSLITTTDLSHFI